jgi:uncharacterized protein (TIGR00730 family)
MLTAPFRRIAVFCGSHPGADPRFMRAARALGHDLATRSIGIVYGGASNGCMGALADGALAAGGEVIGVLPHGLAERTHPGLTRCELVDSMHARKARMAELSDAVIALPGGYGTFDELFEALTWSQLGIDRKPIGLLDAGEYWQPLLRMLDQATANEFLLRKNRNLLCSAFQVDVLLDELAQAVLS